MAVPTSHWSLVLLLLLLVLQICSCLGDDGTGGGGTAATTSNPCPSVQCTEINRYCHEIVIDNNDNDNSTIAETATSAVCGPCLVGYIELFEDDDNINNAGNGAATVPASSSSSTSSSSSSSSRGGSSTTMIQRTTPCIAIDDLPWELFVANYEPFYKQMNDETVVIINSTSPTSPQPDPPIPITTAQRLAALRESAQLISEHNANSSISSSSTTTTTTSTYELGLTPFSADVSTDYVDRSGYFYVNLSGTSEELNDYISPTVAAADLPQSVDWVDAGAVTSVKDQGRCGCCWAISLAGAVEGTTYIEHRYFQSMSFQQFISCNNRNLGCDGGNLQIGALYATLNSFGGLVRLNDYEYTDYRGTTTDECSLSDDSTPLAVEINEPTMVAGLHIEMSYERRVEAFKQALTERPISMIMKSACKTFSNYKSGILTDDGDCEVFTVSDIDHAVLMVGYGTDESSGISYFKLKNSWGTKWGEDGYFRIADTEKNSYGLFGIFAEGVVVTNARNVTAEVPDQSQDVPLPVWAIVLISIAGCCCCITMFGVCRRMRDDR